MPPRCHWWNRNATVSNFTETCLNMWIIHVCQSKHYSETHNPNSPILSDCDDLQSLWQDETTNTTDLKRFCHQLFNLMLFQTCLTFFHQWNTKQAVLGVFMTIIDEGIILCRQIFSMNQSDSIIQWMIWLLSSSGYLSRSSSEE